MNSSNSGKITDSDQYEVTKTSALLHTLCPAEGNSVLTLLSYFNLNEAFNILS